MIAEAIDAATAIWQALLAWIVVGALLVTAVVFGTAGLLVLAGRWAWKGARRALYGRESHEQALPGIETHPAPERDADARTGPHDWKAAA